MDVKITFLCDNINGALKGFRRDPGFSALLKTGGSTILFDTGMYEENLVHNLSCSGHRPGDIDAVILSHNHADHTNGVPAVLRANPEVPVYIHSRWDERVLFPGPGIPDRNRVAVKNPGKQPGLPENIFITEPQFCGDFGGISEQALFMKTEKSLILLTGCCHAGLSAFLEQRSVTGTGENIPLHLMGGMHGFSFSDSEAREIYPEIISIVLCHCTQNTGIFKRQFREKCSLPVQGEEYCFE